MDENESNTECQDWEAWCLLDGMSAGCRGRWQMESDDTVEEAEAEEKAGFSRRLVSVINSHAEEEQPCLDRGLVCIVSFGEMKVGRNLSHHYLPTPTTA